jgi:glycosyltransferase involved in cell wall biosynthesis
MYFFSLCYCLIRLKRRYDIYIGVSQFFALCGAILKKLKVTKSLIYYCLDYWTPDAGLNFNSLFVKFINLIDRFSVKNADYIWDLKANLSEERQKIGKIKNDSYRKIVVPLGYSASLRRFKPLEQADRWQLGFVGSITHNQGLPLLVEALPRVLQDLPEVKVKVIGQGPYLEELKQIVHEKDLDNHFDFTGFIKDENRMLDILTNSAIALALYSADMQNIACADTGKPKLYALCGLPMITTNLCSLSVEVTRHNAGAVINYNRQELERAIIELMGDEERLRQARQNSFRLGEQFISDRIFDEAFKKMGI